MKRRQVEMADGRIYYSDDGWATVWLQRKGESNELVGGKEADLVRFFVAMGAADKTA